ncbi:hypothetical protein AB1286_00510 [Trinickia sp. NRRL B-1857]|uniref:hypothetical protein n=1 Tax=Trinickia sp. NRRL B-1857 TaxID=3162879 RepID=UPI003D2A14D3
MQAETKNESPWTFGVQCFKSNGPKDDTVVCGKEGCHILLVYRIWNQDNSHFDNAGVATYTLLDAMSGIDIAMLTDWQDGWSYSVTDVTPSASVKDSGFIVVEFIVNRTFSGGAHSHSIMIAPGISYTLSDNSGTIYWDGCLAGGYPIAQTITSVTE